MNASEALKDQRNIAAAQQAGLVLQAEQVTGSQWLILSIMAKRERATSEAEIKSRMPRGADPQAASQEIHTLVERGWLLQNQDQYDLTGSGRFAVARIETALENVNRATSGQAPLSAPTPASVAASMPVSNDDSIAMPMVPNDSVIERGDVPISMGEADAKLKEERLAEIREAKEHEAAEANRKSEEAREAAVAAALKAEADKKAAVQAEQDRVAAELAQSEAEEKAKQDNSIDAKVEKATEAEAAAKARLEEALRLKQEAEDAAKQAVNAKAEAEAERAMIEEQQAIAAAEEQARVAAEEQALKAAEEAEAAKVAAESKAAEDAAAASAVETHATEAVETAAVRESSPITEALPRTTLQELIGFSRSISRDGWVFISGTTGMNPATGMISPHTIIQAQAAMGTIEYALADEGVTFADVVQVRYIAASREDFETCIPVFEDVFGKVRPAASIMIAELLDPRMKIQIEIVARRRS